MRIRQSGRKTPDVFLRGLPLEFRPLDDCLRELRARLLVRGGLFANGIDLSHDGRHKAVAIDNEETP